MHSRRQLTALIVLAGLLMASCSGVGPLTSQPQTTDLPTISVPTAQDAGDEQDTATLPAEDVTPPADEATPADGDGAVVTGGWVAGGERVAIYVQWTQDAGGNLAGTYDQSSLADGGTSVKPLHSTITGFISSGQITLHLAGGLMGSLTMTGTISDEELDLAFPQADGTIITNRLIPGDTNDYNERVAGLRSAASSGAQDAAQSRAAQQSVDEQAAQVRQDQSAVDTAARVLASDIDNVPNETGNVDNDISNLSDTLDSQGSDVDQLKSDLETFATDLADEGKGGGSVCYDTGTLDFDLEGLSSDHQSVLDAITNGSAQALRERVAAIQTDSQALTDAVSAADGYTSTDAPADSDVTAALATANKKLTEWGTKAAEAKKQSQTALDKARSDVAAAKAKSGC